MFAVQANLTQVKAQISSLAEDDALVERRLRVVHWENFELWRGRLREPGDIRQLIAGGRIFLHGRP